MKRALAILITLLFLFNTMGYYFVFLFTRQMVRNEMQQSIKAGSYGRSSVVMDISNPSKNPDFKRISKDEFLYKDKLYDIISESVSPDRVVFVCIHDMKEDRLFATLHHFNDASSGQNDQSRAKHALALIYHVIKLAAVAGTPYAPDPAIPQTISYNSIFYSLSSIFYSPPSPPPESC